MTAPKRRISTRGASILAAFVLAVVLGGFAIAFESANVALNNQALLAAPAATAIPLPPPRPAAAPQLTDVEKAQKAAADSLAQKCDAAIKQAKTKTPPPKPGEKATDDCVAAAPDSGKNPPFKCVGKSVFVSLLTNNTINIKGAPDPNMKPGLCKTIVCKSTPGSNLSKKLGIAPDTVDCAPATTMQGINYDLAAKALQSSLDQNSNFQLLARSGGTAKISSSIPSTSLSDLNIMLGRQLTDTSDFKLSPDGSLPEPAIDQIRKYADENPNSDAAKASKEVTADALKLNPGLGDGKTLTPSADDAAKKAAAEAAAKARADAEYQRRMAENNAKYGGGNTTGFNDGNRSSQSGGSNPLASFLSGLMNAFRPTPPPPPSMPPQACPTDPAQYQQQQQQFQQQMQQYNYQLQLYQYQQQVQQMQQTGGNSMQSPMMPPPAQPVPCTPSTGGQCQSQPPPPNPENCSVGSWRPTYNGPCIVGWQCVPNNSTTLKAEISCQPKVADVGMTIAIAYSCSSGIASSKSFKVTTQPAGSATTTVANPPSGTNTATYMLTCTEKAPPGQGRPDRTAGAQCSVQVNRPSIVLVANPRSVQQNSTSLIGWTTSGMQTCVISSPDQPDFTARNSSNTSVNGTATTSPITADTRFLLHCETIPGGTKDATTTVRIAQ
ncbi:MAG: hypothetical protein Q7S50_02660 [bacterium]|nr:hypothetical protein [bacterium]